MFEWQLREYCGLSDMVFQLLQLNWQAFFQFDDDPGDYLRTKPAGQNLSVEIFQIFFVLYIEYKNDETKFNSS